MELPNIITQFNSKIVVNNNGVCCSRTDKEIYLPEEVDRVLITRECILRRVEAMAEEIAKSHKELFAVIVLVGARAFFNDLKKALERNNVRVEHDEIKLTSYSGTESSGKVSINMDIKKSVIGKNVLIIEDIIDTGTTLSFLKDYLLKEKKAKSVKICALLDKPSRRKVNIDFDYVGFHIPNEFIIGYGVDYNEKYRELPYIALMKK